MTNTQVRVIMKMKGKQLLRRGRKPRTETDRGETEMTNAMIILWESVDLMAQGILQGSGRTILVEDKDGNEIEVELPESIHTYQRWKELGYQVRKGEHAVAKIRIWKHTARQKDENPTEYEERMFMKNAAFFKASQVDKIEEIA